MKTRRRIAALLAMVAAVGLCAHAHAAGIDRTATDTDTDTAPRATADAAGRRCAVGKLPDGAAERTFAVPGWRDRDYDLVLPRTHRCGEPIGVVVVFHGGGGNKDNMRPLTCPGGDRRSSECLDRTLLAAGFAVVFPNGTDAKLARLVSRGGLRTWNAGGGGSDWICANGVACKSGVDDIAYTRALLADVARRIDVDGARIHATGFSNGGALSHRLACEMADLFAAVAPVSGENQFSVAAACRPAAPVAVLAIHGTADACWPYDGGPRGCLEKDGRYISVADTLAGWAARMGCAATPRETTLPPRAGVPADGTSVVQLDHDGCSAGNALRHLRVVGDGHYWPNGEMYVRSARVGGTLSRQLDTAQAIADFFVAHPKR